MPPPRPATCVTIAVVVAVVLTGCASTVPPAAVGPIVPSAAAEPTSATTTTATTTQPRPAPRLRILLTDDDGYDAGGIRAVREALTRAGHDVVEVAPEDNRSGTGAQTTDEQELRDTDDPGVRTVAGSPADAVLAGLAAMRAAGRPPDLVVSGTNLAATSDPGSPSRGRWARR